MDEIMERDKIMKHSKIKDAEWILELHGMDAITKTTKNGRR